MCARVNEEFTHMNPLRIRVKMTMNAKHPTYLAAVDFSSYSSGDNETASCGSNSCSSSSSASSYRFSAYSGSYVINASRGSNNDSALSTSSSSSSSSSSDGSRPTVMAEKDHQGRLNQSEFAASCLRSLRTSAENSIWNQATID